MARRRTKKDDMLAYPYTPEKINTQRSGWCMTDYHEGCPYQFNHGKCPCECHSKTEPVTAKKRGRPKKTEGIKPELIIVDEVNPDPRPWKRNNE